MQQTNEMALPEFSAYCKTRLQQHFLSHLGNIPSPELKEAMEYALLNGGKHLRPLMVYTAGSIFDARLENLDIPACAVEIMHTYSLVHDDLPCMDNADLRRGKPTCHKQFNEGLAVLAGDALQTLAIQIIASHPAPLSAEKRLRMIDVLTNAAGPLGMAAGQALDISMMGDKTLTSAMVLDIHRLKTGALFTACLQLGWLASDDDDIQNLRALTAFGDCIGLAFQIQDDILDIEGSTQQLGKPAGADNQNNTLTYPKIHGLDAAKEKVQTLYLEALACIDYLGESAQLLRDLAHAMVARKK